MNDKSENEKNQKHSERDKRQPFNEHENASANRGGTTDMDEDALTISRGNRTSRGSGMSTKRSVTGSDYDGQVSPG